MKAKPTTFLVEESGDELNDETFGGLDDNAIAKPDFEFGGGMSPMVGSPASSGRRAMTAAELEQQLLAGRHQASPPMHRPYQQHPHHYQQHPQQQNYPAPPIPISKPRRVVMNLDELENSFRSSASISSSPLAPMNDLRPMSPMAAPVNDLRPMSPPPGLVRQKTPKPPVQITFPKAPEDENEDRHPSDQNRFLMSKYEREGIRHIHMAQLTTENPLLEDFYYQAFSKRSLKHQNQSNTPLYLPLPNMKKKPVSKERIRNHNYFELYFLSFCRKL